MDLKTAASRQAKASKINAAINDLQALAGAMLSPNGKYDTTALGQLAALEELAAGIEQAAKHLRETLRA